MQMPDNNADDLDGSEYEFEHHLLKKLCEIMELNADVSDLYKDGFEDAIGYAKAYILATK